MSGNECLCKRDLSSEETTTTKEKVIELYNKMLALADEEPEITTGEVDIHFWHGERRLLTLHQFIGFGEIVPTMRYLSCEKEIPIEEITLSCEKGGDIMRPYVCVPCGREMEVKKTGVVAIEYTSAVGAPYKAYSFDKFKCPKCGHEVLLGHGEPVGRWRNDFEKWLEQAELTFY